MKKVSGLTEWQDFIQEQAKSGKTVAAFCQERGVTRGRFFWWKKRLREEKSDITERNNRGFLCVKDSGVKLFSGSGYEGCQLRVKTSLGHEVEVSGLEMDSALRVIERALGL